MIDPQVREEIERASPFDRCTYVIEWRMDPRDLTMPERASRRDRVSALAAFYKTLKSPLIEDLDRAGASVKDLSTSPQAIVSAVASVWRELVSTLESDATVRVLPNKKYSALV